MFKSKYPYIQCRQIFVIILQLFHALMTSTVSPNHMQRVWKTTTYKHTQKDTKRFHCWTDNFTKYETNKNISYNSDKDVTIQPYKIVSIVGSGLKFLISM